MFTGLVEGLGEVVRVEKKKDNSFLLIKPNFSWEEKNLGESVAVNGVCLTAAAWIGEMFSLDVSEETLSRTNLGRLKVGDRVNLERALRLSDRLGGHLVTGHIDGTGRILQKVSLEQFFRLTVSIPQALRPFLVEKGSITVDGISLTVNGVGEKEFELTIIPHTGSMTTLGLKKIGDEVNLETDLIGKYVYQFMSRRGDEGLEKKTNVNADFLRKHGFL